MREHERSPGLPIEDPPIQVVLGRPQPVRNPPPEGFSPEKWSAMSRRERRAFERAMRKQGK
jgi:hypothetical protein